MDHAYAHTHAHQVEKARLAAEEKENAESKKAEGTDKAAKKKASKAQKKAEQEAATPKEEDEAFHSPEEGHI